MTEQRMPADEDRPIEEWGDRELMDHHRYLQTEIGDEDREYLDSDESPLRVVEEEMRRRRLLLDDEQI